MIIGYLYGSMLKELLRFKRIGIWLVVCVVLYGMGLAFSTYNRTPNADNYPQLSGALIFKFLPLIATIFSTTVLAQEVEQKTIVYLLTRPVQRYQMILMRTLAAITVTAILGIIAAICVSFAAKGGSFLSNELLYRDFKGIIIGSAAYCSLFVFISLLLNRALVACLLYAFGWELMIPNMQGSMYQLSIASHIEAICERPQPATGSNPVTSFLSGSFGTNLLTPSTSWMVLIGLTVVMLGLSMFWFMRSEFLPREDAE
ncbi:MAG: ABC transporter permease subunit [Fimbriimonadaceae bacterium]